MNTIPSEISSKVQVTDEMFARAEETVSDPNTGEVIIAEGRYYSETESMEIIRALTNLGIEAGEVMEYIELTNEMIFRHLLTKVVTFSETGEVLENSTLIDEINVALYGKGAK